MNCICVKEYDIKRELRSKFALSSTHVAISNSKDAILLDFQQPYDMGIELSGHHSAISALKFTNFQDETLVTASSDYIIMWNLREIMTSHKNGEPVRGHVLCTSINTPHHLTILSDLLCSISENVLFVCEVKSKQILFEMEIKDLSCAKFLNKNQLVLSTFNGAVMLLDVNKQEITWEINSSYCLSLTSLSSCEVLNKFSTGSSVAVINEYMFDDKANKFKEFLKIDLDENLMRANKNWKQNGNGDESRGHVIAMMYVNHSHDHMNNFMEQESHLLCAAERALFTINCENQEVFTCGYMCQDIGPPLVSDAFFTKDESSGKIYCAISLLFEPKIIVCNIVMSQQQTPAIISMLSRDPLVSDSVLGSLTKLNKPVKPKKDKPVTFKSKVKSSGYSSSPRMTMFKPITSSSKHGPPKSQPIKSFSTLAIQNTSADWSTDVTVKHSVKLCSKNTSITCISVNDRNQYVAFGLNDATAQVARLPLPSNSGKFKVITGHNQSVSGCSWSHDKDILMTYSSNREIKLWSTPFTGESILSFEMENTGKVSKDLVHSQFYYLDKFMLSALGNSLYMHKYVLHEGPKDDVKRYLNQSKQKQVGSWPMVSAQSVTCMTAPNNMYSYIAMLCGSDRSLEIRDMNVEKIIYRCEDAHTRAPHAIHHCTGTAHVTNGNCDVFITSAPSDGIKLWDLRSQKCVLKFNQHSCVSKCDVTISPCSKFIATAADDIMVCIYDARKKFPLHDVIGRDKVTSLSFTADAKGVLAGTDTSKVLKIAAI